MKRWICVVLVLVFAAALFSFPAAAIDGFGPVKEAEIISAWLAKYTSGYGVITEDTAVVIPYYTDGTLYIFGVHGDRVREDLCTWDIGDYRIRGSSDDIPYVYLNGEVVYLSDAYESGLVNNAVLMEMKPGYDRKVRAGMYNFYDIDEDGKVSVSDVVALRTAISEGEYAYRMDVDGNMSVSVSDVIALRLRLLAG